MRNTEDVFQKQRNTGSQEEGKENDEEVNRMNEVSHEDIKNQTKMDGHVTEIRENA